MIATTTLIDQLIGDTKTCQNIAKKYWLPSPEARAWKDEHFGWSIDDIQQHLTAFATRYIPEMEAQIKLAQSNGSTPQPEFNMPQELAGFFGQLSYEGLEQMTKLGHFEQIDVEVAPNYDATKLHFLAIQKKLISLLEASKTVDIMAIPIPSIIQPDTNFTLGECFIFLIKHQILHFAQAELIMKSYSKSIAA